MLTRNLSAIDWCKKNPGGTRAAFEAYWDSSKGQEVKQASQAPASASGPSSTSQSGIQTTPSPQRTR
ncbi:hypothetical protein B0H34DRAFT_801734 [Crassisporium funariophilum]|nr:hypothetical protein B0H34DRAFT_801734 [Crassisporium funariophilum]